MNEIINFGNGKRVKVVMMRGLQGEDGRGIVSIEKTSTLGRVDTYTITYTDGTTSTFEVTNGGGSGGAVDTVNGQTGNVVLDAEDVGALPDTTTLSDLTQDSTHRTVTDAQITDWTAKVGSVNGQTGNVQLSASDVGALPSDTTLAQLPQNSAYRTVSDTEKATWNGKTTTDYTLTVTEGVKLGDIIVDGVYKGVYAPKYSNPNLLDNPWFTINQKGWTTGTVQGNTSKPIFDRWGTTYGGGNDALGTITLNSDHTVKFHAVVPSGRYGRIYLKQNLEDNIKSALGTHAKTISILLSDGRIFTQTFTNKTFTRNSFIFDVATDTELRGDLYYREEDSPAVITIGIGAKEESGTATDITIKAVKLELGIESTLALDVAPDYATELMKCQRFYRKLNLSDCIGMTSRYQSVSDTHYVNSIWDIPMRAIPTVTYTSGSVDGVLSVVGATTRTIITKSIVDISSDINGNLMITTDTSDTTNVFTPLNPVFVNASGIEFNAEL